MRKFFILLWLAFVLLFLFVPTVKAQYRRVYYPHYQIIRPANAIRLHSPIHQVPIPATGDAVSSCHVSAMAVSAMAFVAAATTANAGVRKQ